jgi:hypothetical protein
MPVIAITGPRVQSRATGRLTPRCRAGPQFQSSYQQDSDFWSLLTEHTYYLLPLVFESAMPNHMDRASYYHTAGWMSETAYRVYHLLPLVAVLAINFVSKVRRRPGRRAARGAEAERARCGGGGGLA